MYMQFQARKNQLLAALPDSEFQSWLPLLESIALPLGQVIYESATTPRHIYFPTTAIVSMLFALDNGRATEIAMVGNEGAIGISLVTGGEQAPCRALVQSGGRGLRLPASALNEAFHSSVAVRRLMLTYMQALIVQIQTTAACNRHHSVDQQVCCWLLKCQDRMPSNELSATQDLIARMLGVRREGVTATAGSLQAAGIISYERGQITVLDRQRLELRSCECYAVVKAELARLRPRSPGVSSTNWASSISTSGGIQKLQASPASARTSVHDAGAAEAV